MTDLFERHAPVASNGPLHRIRVLALGGKGPVPHACTILSDLGARVVRIERPRLTEDGELQESKAVLRGQGVLEIDLRSSRGVAQVRDLANSTDVVIEGFRPGVAERLGVGPDELRSLHHGLIYARMTGWGQSGPWHDVAAHDVNFLAVAGVLDRIGRVGGEPTIPLNLIGDYSAGSMFLAVGVLAALVHRGFDGEGDTIDVSMLEGLLALDHASWVNRNDPLWSGPRGTNLLDGGAPFYTVYATADSRYMAVAAMERRYFINLLKAVGADLSFAEAQLDRDRWPQMRRELAHRFRLRTMEEWSRLFREVDACVTPVLTMPEVARHEQVQARSSLITVDGILQHAATPRFKNFPAAAGDHVK